MQRWPKGTAKSQGICATVVDVNQPVTERPKIPSLGRLGLVDERAGANLAKLGWNTEAHVGLLWSLSRAPDADAALCAMVRLVEANAVSAYRRRTASSLCCASSALPPEFTYAG